MSSNHAWLRGWWPFTADCGCVSLHSRGVTVRVWGHGQRPRLNAGPCLWRTTPLQLQVCGLRRYVRICLSPSSVRLGCGLESIDLFYRNETFNGQCSVGWIFKGIKMYRFQLLCLFSRFCFVTIFTHFSAVPVNLNHTGLPWAKQVIEDVDLSSVMRRAVRHLSIFIRRAGIQSRRCLLSIQTSDFTPPAIHVSVLSFHPKHTFATDSHAQKFDQLSVI